jgi:hypothetical protein
VLRRDHSPAFLARNLAKDVVSDRTVVPVGQY